MISGRIFLTGRGPAIQYEASVKMARHLFLSDDFKRSHPVPSNIIVGCAAKPFSKWTVVPAPRPQCLRLVTDAQDTDTPLVFGPTRFLAFCQRPTATSMGACGI